MSVQSVYSPQKNLRGREILLAVVLVAASALSLAYPLSTPLVAAAATVVSYLLYRRHHATALLVAAIMCAVVAVLGVTVDVTLLKVHNGPITVSPAAPAH